MKTLSLPYLIYTLVSLPVLSLAQSGNSITIGSSLTAGEERSSYLASPSKEFAFGFREIEAGSFLLAIWFDVIPEKTITWSANRDSLAPRGSQLALTTENGLVLTAPNGQQIWRATWPGNNSRQLGYGALLDTGNFVLTSTQGGSFLWQSFNEPTDTMLPTQTLNVGDQLISQFAQNNLSSGRFMLQLGTDGVLGLYTTNFPLFDAVNTMYWTASTQGQGYQLVFNQTGPLYLFSKKGNILSTVFSQEVPKESYYQRVTIEYDGVLRHYVYPKPSSSMRKSTGWFTPAFIPSNICTAVIEQTGSGVCGFNSYCSIGNDKRPYCTCAPGYILTDPDNQMSGCTQNFLPQSCQEPASQRDGQFDMKVFINVDWKLSDYDHFENVNKDWCREECLGDCFCAVSVFQEGGNCWKKRLPFSNGMNDSSVSRTAFIKVRTTGGLGSTPKNKVWVILFGMSGFMNIVLVGFLFLGFLAIVKYKKIKGSIFRAKADESYSVRAFKYKELIQATNNFKEELGSGAFGVVYKGVIPGSNTYIAVKKLNSLTQDADKEFKTEVNVIAHTHHKNLVRLIGYCNEEEQRLLVYEYMSNGTLSDFLHAEPKPSWEKRMRIAQGIARGLFYLHEDCNAQIIHCDIKPQNILLDDDHNARISDFGLAKLLKLDQTQTSTVARGTRGYVAPEWFNNMPITTKVDVYSFGVLLLEIVCCRKNVITGDEEEVYPSVLTDEVFDCYQEGDLKALVKEDVEALADVDRLESMIKVGMWCIQSEPTLRPIMKVVVLMLQGLVKIPDPPTSSTSV